MRIDFYQTHDPANKYTIRTGNHHGKVLLQVDGKILSITTPDAVRIGLGIQKKLNELTNFGLDINGEKFVLTPDVAKQVSASLIRQADFADDWQRKLI